MFSYMLEDARLSGFAVYSPLIIDVPVWTVGLCNPPCPQSALQLFKAQAKLKSKQASLLQFSVWQHLFDYSFQPFGLQYSDLYLILQAKSYQFWKVIIINTHFADVTVLEIISLKNRASVIFYAILYKMEDFCVLRHGLICSRISHS